MFGVSKILAGLYYKTPVPIQPMKAIGAAAVAGGATPPLIFGAGITTGLFWFILGITGAIRWVTNLVSKPVVRGIMLGLEGLVDFTIGLFNKNAKYLKTEPLISWKYIQPLSN
jgi:predicted benzoate:H+ symporter BenE